MSHSKFYKNQAGQAVTEYVLVLFVIVALIFGGMFQLNTAFKAWANNYFGDYLSCLLETGELPSIGGAPGDSGICNELFKPFNIQDGRRLAMPGGGGSGEPGSRDPRGGGEKGVGSREQRPSGSYVRNGPSGRGSSLARNSNRGRAQNINRFGKEKDKYTGSTDASMAGGVGYRSGQDKGGRPQFVRVDNQRFVDAREERDEESRSSKTVKKDESSSTVNSSRIKLKRRDIAKVEETPDEPFTIGNFFRLLLIAAIIIALFVLLGGQALQISKNSE